MRARVPLLFLLLPASEAGPLECLEGAERDVFGAIVVRCAADREAVGCRCCWPGQALAPPDDPYGVCVGPPARCPAGYRATDAGCAPDPPLSYPMERIPGGAWQIGTPEDEIGREANEQLHPIRLPTFYIGAHEVTQFVWDRVRELDVDFDDAVRHRDPSRFDCDACPVEQVTWYEAIHFANALSRIELGGGRECYSISSDDPPSVSWPAGLDCVGYRLPTAAEWEVAARGGLSGQARAAFPGGGDLRSEDDLEDCSGELLLSDDSTLDQQAWYCGNARNKTHPTGQKAANGYGLYDMSGNVWEWVWDLDRRDYRDLTGADPAAAAAGAGRVYRGGAWNGQPRVGRAGDRYRGDPSDRYTHVGFRLARSVGP